jgi:NTE family protein
MMLWSTAWLLALLRTLAGIPTRRIERMLASIHQSLPVWGSLTTAFERALNKLFGAKTVHDVSRDGLHVVINACDLRTGTAFRFGSKKSGGWRYGQVVGTVPPVAKAVAASAAFPVLLPPLVETFEFLKGGRTQKQTVALADGGVFDNLGVSILEPGRDDEITDTYPVTHIVSLNAGPGQLEGGDRPFWWGLRSHLRPCTASRKITSTPDCIVTSKAASSMASRWFTWDSKINGCRIARPTSSHVRMSENTQLISRRCQAKPLSC